MANKKQGLKVKIIKVLALQPRSNQASYSFRGYMDRQYPHITIGPWKSDVE